MILDHTALLDLKVGSHLEAYSFSSFQIYLLYRTSAPLVPGLMSQMIRANLSS